MAIDNNDTFIQNITSFINDLLNEYGMLICILKYGQL